MPKPIVRTIAIVASAAFAVGLPIVESFGGFGLSEAEFSYDGDETLSAAGYAFAIWGLIYLGLVVYAGYHVLPSTPESPTLRRFGWPSVFAMTGCALWLIAASADWKWATVALIVSSALALMLALTAPRSDETRAEARFVVTPMALLAGWLTIASAINTLTVLTAVEVINADSALLWALGGEMLVAILAFFAFRRSRSVAYIAPVVWGFIAVAVAEWTHRAPAAWLALTLAALLGAVAVIELLRRRNTAR